MCPVLISRSGTYLRLGVTAAHLCDIRHMSQAIRVSSSKLDFQGSEISSGLYSGPKAKNFLVKVVQCTLT
jgi:hypothetical protein